jgi:hypothetical protein
VQLEKRLSQLLKLKGNVSFRVKVNVGFQAMISALVGKEDLVLGPKWALCWGLG